MSRLLLLSNSTMPGAAFFSWPSPYVKAFLGAAIREVVFIPFAAVTLPWDEYAGRVSSAFQPLGYTVRSLHREADKAEAIRNAAAIVTGGGNTFALLSRLYGEGLLAVIRDRVSRGVPYIGWSAGANLACPTIMTTNDMPVVMPPSLDALNLVPFQLNPHYHELKFESQGGETRRERLAEFLALNPARKIIGLPEGMLLRREGEKLFVEGCGAARLFESGRQVTEWSAGADMSFLFEGVP